MVERLRSCRSVALNRDDKEKLALNWELQRERSRNCDFRFSIDLSSGCYVEFGTVGVAVYKYWRGNWYRKIVNAWKSLNFAAFMESFNEAEWEKV